MHPQLLAPVDFDFKDKSILLVDDRIKTGSTIRLACELLKSTSDKNIRSQWYGRLYACLTRRVLKVMDI